ncbi:MAG TPA: glycosyltransferase family 87 protein, partial [Chloroflexota bacterium]|nr:glycosyltransferase family 87 protein [Chloroflexota bacterium]
MPTRRRLQLACLILFAVSLGLHGWDLSAPGLLDRTGRLKCPDFLQFYTYGTLARTGDIAGLYDPDTHANVARAVIDPQLSLALFHPNYSPAIAWLFAPLSRLPYLRAMIVWLAISSTLYLLSIAMLLPAVRHLHREAQTIWLVAIAWPAFFIVLRYGQLSTLSLAILIVAVRCAARGQPLAAGMALGCLVYKPNLLVVPALTLLMVGEWRMVIGLVAGAMLESLAAMTLAGRDVYAQYIGVLVTIAKHPEMVQLYPAESHSIGGALRLWSAPPALVMVATAIALLLAVFGCVTVWRSTTDHRPRWASLVLAALVSSPHLLTYDLLLLVVPIVLIADWVWDITGKRPDGAWLALLVMLYLGAWPG